MLVLSSPSGAGKTTLSRRLLQAEPQLEFSVSATTRPKRPAETEGRDYHFVSEEQFAQMRERGGLLEHSEIYGHHYGTPGAQVEAVLHSGHDMIFELDAKGMHALKAAKPEDVVSVFILPPSVEELTLRLRSRAQDDEATLQRRLARVSEELKHWDEYDYVIVNQTLDVAQHELSEILHAERQRRHRRTGLHAFVSRLIQP
jgi:guanylate kinase